MFTKHESFCCVAPGWVFALLQLAVGGMEASPVWGRPCRAGIWSSRLCCKFCIAVQFRSSAALQARKLRFVKTNPPANLSSKFSKVTFVLRPLLIQGYCQNEENESLDVRIAQSRLKAQGHHWLKVVTTPQSNYQYSTEITVITRLLTTTHNLIICQVAGENASSGVIGQE